ncbi:hypothetical protein IAQ61_011547, partial [Plenodomus lingam]|uniref:Predicted protein n=1 Tax=Leptosphaeria maculans (strain JN3 / isolate v23.1.3 / race Av1-4-5-6-7-8) TaxID=985895 RepID=E5AAE5_LEPMJ
MLCALLLMLMLVLVLVLVLTLCFQPIPRPSYLQKQKHLPVPECWISTKGGMHAYAYYRHAPCPPPTLPPCIRLPLPSHLEFARFSGTQGTVGTAVFPLLVG